MKSSFPITAKSQLVTLCTFKWIRDYKNAPDAKKDEMMRELKSLKNDAEQDGLLHNSREFREEEE